MLLPPRKLDLYTFTLCGVCVVSAEELTFGSASPRARVQNGGAGTEAGEGEGSRKRTGAWFGDRDPGPEANIGAGKARARIQTQTLPQAQPNLEPEDTAPPQGGLRSLLRQLWMGDEEPGWQRRRLERERQELESGKGYGDIIMEQVWEVFPGFGGREVGGEDGDGIRGEGEGEGEGRKGEGRRRGEEGRREGRGRGCE